MNELKNSRRQFISRAGTASAMVGFGNLGFLADLRPVSASEVQVDPAEGSI